jgi:DNA invertase Pin-like site-specific DNA recombinase
MARPKKSQNEQPERTAVIYARVSSKEQAEGYSIDAQLDLNRTYCHKIGARIVREFVEAESAKNDKREKREAFKTMVDFLRAGGAQMIVTEKTDRIYRNLKDRVTIDDLALELHLVKENTVLSPTSRSHEKFVHDIKVVVAKNYIDNLSEETKKGMAEKAKQGIWQSFAPLGYQNVATGSKRTIAPDPHLAPLIRRLFETYATGEYSLKNAGEVAHALGLRTRKGARVAISQIHLILHNPLYVGMVPWNGQTFPGQHEPIIDRITFERVQRIMEGRQNTGPGVSPKTEFAYRGLFKCAKCGCAMTPEIKKGKHIYYRCTGYRGCDKRSIKEEQITAQIAQVLEGLTIRPACLETLKQALKEAAAEQKQDHTESLEMLQAEEKRLQTKLEQLYLDKLSGEVPASIYPKLRDQWESELSGIQTLIASHDRANRATWEDNVQMLETVSNAPLIFKTANSELRREMLKNLVSNAQIYEDKVLLTLRPWFKLILQANLRVIENDRLEGQKQNWLPVLNAFHLARAA